MRRTLTAALGALAFVFLCGFSLSMPAPAGSIQGYPFCTTAPTGTGFLRFNGANWCNTRDVTVSYVWATDPNGITGYIEVGTPASADIGFASKVYNDPTWRFIEAPGTGLQIGDGTIAPTTVINESKQWVGAPIGTAYGGTGVTVGISTVTGPGTFTTNASVLSYRAIVIAGSGGGGSSTGAGYGGNGGTPSPTTCQLMGGGQAYAVAIGSAGSVGSAGATGGTGGATGVTAGTGATVCVSYGGLGGTNGTATNGAGGATGVVPGLTPILDASAPANLVGLVYYGVAGQIGTTGGVTPNCAFGICGGLGCAGASCTADTAGTAGKVIFIPEL